MLGTDGIVLRTTKYGETSIISDIFTREEGLIGCIAGGVRKKNSIMAASIFQILQPVHLIAYYKEGRSLNRIKEVKPIFVLYDIHAHPVKRTILIFLAELLQKSLKVIEKNEALFDYLLNFLLTLEQSDKTLSSFPLEAMLDISNHLGFYPQNNYSPEFPYFHLGDGRFQTNQDTHSTLSQEESQSLSTVVLAKEEDREITLTKNQRREALRSFVKYFQWHIPNFGEMKSPEILQAILT